jgi:hypothetical protein
MLIIGAALLSIGAAVEGDEDNHWCCLYLRLSRSRH